MQFHKKIIPLAAVLVCLAYACHKENKPDAVNIATVGERAISLDTYTESFKRLRASAGDEKPEEIKELKSELINRLVEEELILQEAEKLGIKLGSGELAAEIDAMKKDHGDESFKDVITERYGDFSKWKEEINRKLLVKKTVEAAVAGKIIVSEEEAQKYYKAHKSEFNAPERVHARMIAVTSEDDARRIRKTLTPQNFAETAQKFSLGPEGRNGGDLGAFSRGEMPKEFEDVIFSLKLGEISRVIKTNYGYHIFYLEGKMRGGRKTFAEMKGSIIARLKAGRLEEGLLQWVDGLKHKTKITVREELL